MSKINIILKNKRPTRIGQAFKYSDWYCDFYNISVKNKIFNVKSIKKCCTNNCEGIIKNYCHGSYINDECSCNSERGTFIELINNNIEILEDGSYVVK